MPATQAGQLRDQLLALERGLCERAEDLAVFLVYDRPDRILERPGLERTFFVERCLPEEQLDQIVDAFRSVGAHAEVFAGEQPLVEALTDGRIERIECPLKVVYNGIEGGVSPDAFEPGRTALVPAIADSYGLHSANSDAYAFALARHKFHYFTLLRSLGLSTPRVWHYRPDDGWLLGNRPPLGAKVIVKSTYEAWSVGVTEDSIFTVDDSCEERVAAIADELGQAATVQDFVAGREVCVPVLACPERIITPPMEAQMAKAPDDADAVMTIHDNLRDGGVSHRPFMGPAELKNQLRRTAAQAFDALQLGSFARIDFRIDHTERAWITDVASSPGISRKSSSCKSLAQLGFDHQSTLRIVIAATLVARGLL